MYVTIAIQPAISPGARHELEARYAHNLGAGRVEITGGGTTISGVSESEMHLKVNDDVTLLALQEAAEATFVGDFGPGPIQVTLHVVAVLREDEGFRPVVIRPRNRPKRKVRKTRTKAASDATL